jgi:hypothetical protein
VLEIAVFEDWELGCAEAAAGQEKTLLGRALPAEAEAAAEGSSGDRRVVGDPALFEPIADHWERPALRHGRPTVAMETYVRLMVVKQRSGWGTRRCCARSPTRCIGGASA